MPGNMTTYPVAAPALIGYDGDITELTDETYRIMRTVLRVVQGEGDGEADPYLSMGQAAELLGVSMETVARYIEKGDIRCVRCGVGHWKVRLSDVLTYKRTRSSRMDELERMREAAAEGGLYDFDLSDQMFAYFGEGRL